MSAIEKTVGRMGALLGFIGKSLKSFWDRATLSTKDDEEIFSELAKSGLFGSDEPQQNKIERITKETSVHSANISANKRQEDKGQNITPDKGYSISDSSLDGSKGDKRDDKLVELEASPRISMLPPNEHIDRCDIANGFVYESTNGEYIMGLYPAPEGESKVYSNIEITQEEYSKINKMSYSEKNSYCISLMEDKMHEAWNMSHGQSDQVIEEIVTLNDAETLAQDTNRSIRR